MKSNRPNGFVLPLAALAVALLAAGLILCLPSSQRLAREVRHAQARLDLERAAVIAENRVAYLLLTEPVGKQGLEIGAGRLGQDSLFITPSSRTPKAFLRFDGRNYITNIDTNLSAIVTIQDKSGLINLNTASQSIIANALMICGLSKITSHQLSGTIMHERYKRSTRLGEGPTFTSFDDLKVLDGWNKLMTGGARRRLSSTMIAEPSTSGLHPMAAPESVLSALRGNNKRGLGIPITDQTNNVNTAIMAANGLHIDQYGLRIPPFRQTPSGLFVIMVQIYDSELTGSLPTYLYTVNLNVTHDRSDRLFTLEGSIVESGSPTRCVQSSGQAVTPLPLAWQAPSRR